MCIRDRVGNEISRLAKDIADVLTADEVENLTTPPPTNFIPHNTGVPQTTDMPVQYIDPAA